MKRRLRVTDEGYGRKVKNKRVREREGERESERQNAYVESK